MIDLLGVAVAVRSSGSIAALSAIRLTLEASATRSK